MYIYINGKANPEMLSRGGRKMAQFINPKENEALLFLGYSAFDIKKGEKFDVVFDRKYPSGGVEFSACKLIRITQQMFQEWDEIPKGWKTIGILEFENGIPQMITNLPQIDSWVHGTTQILISTLNFWKGYSQGLTKLI